MMVTLKILYSSFLAAYIFSSNCGASENYVKNQKNHVIKPTKHEDMQELSIGEIANKDINLLDNVKERWIDPFDMINFQEDIRVSVKEELRTGSIFSNPYMDNDFKPTFSDIKGEIIGRRVVVEDTVLDPSKDSVKSEVKQDICVLDTIYVTRWLKKIIMKIEKDSSLEINSLNFLINMDSINSLKKLSTSKTLDIVYLDELISDLVAKATVTEKYDWMKFPTYTSTVLWAVVAVLFILLILIIFRHCFMYYPKLTIVSFIAVVSVGWHWIHLYQKALARKHAKVISMPVSLKCKGGELGILGTIEMYIKGMFFTDNCSQYYEALMVDPIWEVTLTMAISETLSAMIFQPLEPASKSINIFVKQLYDDLSLFAGVSLTIFLFLLFMMMCKYKLKFPLFMGSLEPSFPSVGSRIEDVKLSRTLSPPSNGVLDRPVAELSSVPLGNSFSTQDIYTPATDVYFSNRKANDTKTTCFHRQKSLNSKVTEISRNGCGLNVLQQCGSYDLVCEQTSSQTLDVNSFQEVQSRLESTFSNNTTKLLYSTDRIALDEVCQGDKCKITGNEPLNTHQDCCDLSICGNNGAEKTVRTCNDKCSEENKQEE